jgi:glycosyltransferase involved in cell wall biosynthesis
MRIAFDAKRAFNNFTGLGNYSRSLIEGLENFFPEHEYFLFTPSARESITDFFSPVSKLILPEKTIHRLFPWLWRSWSLNKDILRLKIDVFHGLSNELPFNAHLLKCKKIVTIHDILFLKQPEDFPAFDRIFYARKTHYASTYADIITVNSTATKNDLVELLKIDEKKIVVIPHAVSSIFLEKKSQNEIAATLEKHHLPKNFLLQTGSFLKRKNHIKTIEAFQEVLKRYSDLFLVFTGGGGSYEKRVLKKISECGLQKNILVKKNVAPKDLPAIYQSAKMVLYPSENEGFGLPLVEAFASGVPVITNDKCVFRETGGSAAWYVNCQSIAELSSAILLLLENKSLKNDLIQRGLKRLELFSEKRLAEQTIKLYESL